MIRRAPSIGVSSSGCAGFALPSAIFLLVILSALAAFLVKISTSQSINSAQDVQAVRAYHAARAGVEWGLYQIFGPASPACAASTTLSAPIEGFTVIVTCTANGPYTEGGQSFSLYRLTSTARSPGTSPGAMAYVERQAQATVSR